MVARKAGKKKSLSHTFASFARLPWKRIRRPEELNEAENGRRRDVGRPKKTWLTFRKATTNKHYPRRRDYTTFKKQKSNNKHYGLLS